MNQALHLKTVLMLALAACTLWCSAANALPYPGPPPGYCPDSDLPPPPGYEGDCGKQDPTAAVDLGVNRDVEPNAEVQNLKADDGTAQTSKICGTAVIGGKKRTVCSYVTVE